MLTFFYLYICYLLTNFIHVAYTQLLNSYSVEKKIIFAWYLNSNNEIFKMFVFWLNIIFYNLVGLIFITNISETI